ncbi:hypothetical protein ElyMa_001649700 [Elysia marginata]|uniref:Uncharacterized protein n=1 Tax=Elysia marginata TaxID=1093978 RepID=A0AAV4JPH1_9GAST|nr:hypothetical protein ElyMa_001649700 [Elysia marginata]
MNTFAVVATFALLAYTVNATPCTDICSAKCALQKQTCDFADVFGNLCETMNAACTQNCNAACGCADGCSAECGEEFATCQNADTSNDAGPFGLASLSVLSCGMNAPVCQMKCQLKCQFNLLAAAADAMGGGAGAGADASS